MAKNDRGFTKKLRYKQCRNSRLYSYGVNTSCNTIFLRKEVQMSTDHALALMGYGLIGKCVALLGFIALAFYLYTKRMKRNENKRNKKT